MAQRSDRRVAKIKLKLKTVIEINPVTCPRYSQGKFQNIPIELFPLAHSHTTEIEKKISNISFEKCLFQRFTQSLQ